MTWLFDPRQQHFALNLTREQESLRTSILSQSIRQSNDVEPAEAFLNSPHSNSLQNQLVRL